MITSYLSLPPSLPFLLSLSLSSPTQNIEMLLAEFFNQTMQAAGLADASVPGMPVLSMWLSAQQTFGFVEFRSEHEATNGLHLNGVSFSG